MDRIIVGAVYALIASQVALTVALAVYIRL
jgi:hypothetical protein